MPRPRLICIAPLLATPLTPAGTCEPDLAPAVAIVEQAVSQIPLQGAVLRIEHEGEVLLNQPFGTFTTDTTLLTASAAKFMAGAVVMSVVDDGLLSLDSTTAEVLGWQGVKGTITLRQLMSHTSGFTNTDCLNDPLTTLEQCVQDIYLNEPLLFPPGSAFFYGGAGMQVAGRMCEVATGLSWNQIAQQNIGDPLGWSVTRWISPTNPRIGGQDGVSTAREYARLLRMLLDGGVYEGQQVLSAAGVAAILSDQAGDVPALGVPPTLDEFLGYGIGCWVFERDENAAPTTLASPGGLGWTPVIDLERDLIVMLVVQHPNEDIAAYSFPLIDAVQTAIDAAELPGDLDGDDEVDTDDLCVLLSAFGQSADGDTDGDADTDFDDLGILLSAFGSGC